MATSLDMSLDDLIKSRSSAERGRGRGRGRGQGQGRGQGRGQAWARVRGGAFRGRPTGMVRRGPLGVNIRPSLYRIAKSFSRAKDLIWQHDLFDDSMVAAGLAGLETGTKLYVSNLDYGVSNEDIKELFSEIGDLKRCAVHYDRNGRPSGSAEVVFTRRSEAMAAVKRYNNVQLDGKAMKIEVIGTNLGLPVTARVNVVGGARGRGRRTVVMTPELGQAGLGTFNRIPGWNRGGFRQGQGRGRGRGRSRGRGGGRGRGRGRKQHTEKSADELNKELETYHEEKMNTS